MGDITELTTCAYCGLVLKKAETYYLVRTPDGEKPVHVACMYKKNPGPKTEPKPGLH